MSALQDFEVFGNQAPTRRKFLTLIGVGAGLAATGPLLAACSSSSTSGQGLAKDQILRLNIGSEPSRLDPNLAVSVAENAVQRPCWEALLGPSPDLKSTRPLAAESYQVSPDGLIWTFKLRKNATWSDGRPVIAKDFVYTWRRILDPRVAAPIADPYYVDTVQGGTQYRNLDPIKDANKIDAYLNTLGLAAVDDYTFQVTVAQSAPYFVWLATFTITAPVRQDVIEKYGADKWDTKPETLISNGPFKIAEIVPKDHITLVPNEKYWGGKPKLAQIVLYEISDQNQEFAKYQNGELDIASVPLTNASLVKNDPKLSKELHIEPVLRTEWIIFNTKRAPFDNIMVRQAIAQAIDRQALVRDVMKGTAIASTTLIPKGEFGYRSQEGASQHFDPTKARATLAASGVDKNTLNGIKILVRNRTYISQVAEFAAGQLNTNLGISASLEVIDFKSSFSRLSKGDFQMLVTYGWTADYPDPQDFYGVLFGAGSGFDYSGYSNPKFDALVQQADHEMDRTKREGLYGQASDILVQDAPAAFLFQLLNWVLKKPYVQNVTGTPIDDWHGELFASQITIASH